MQNITKTTLLSMSVLVLSTTMALAHDRGHGGHGGKGMRGMHELPSFNDLDQNGDGQVSAQELEAFKDGHFVRMDANGDGEISADELVANRQAGLEARAQNFVDRFDANNSGGISEDEMPMRGHGDDGEHATRMIERIDTDGDGQISQAEYDAAQAKMEERHQGKKPADASTMSSDESEASAN